MKTVTCSTKISNIRYCQQCLLCENTRTLPEGMYFSHTPWICDECKEAVAFAKKLKAKPEHDPLKSILD